MGSIIVNGVKYGVGVVANPTIAGTEENLTSIQIGDTKFKIPSGTGTSEEIKLIYQSGTAGTYTFTVSEAGKYLFVLSYSYSGSATITLPSGKTAIIDENVTADNNIVGFKVVIVDLDVGEQVIISTTTNGWNGNYKGIFKLKGIEVNTNIYSSCTRDAIKTTTSSDISGSGKALCISAACGRSENNYWDHSIFSQQAPIFQGYCDTLTVVRITYSDLSTLNDVVMYGYDGGYTGFIALQ